MKKIIREGLLLASFTKMDLKMKLTTILLIVSLFKIQANTYSQSTKLSLDMKNVSVGEVLNKIESISEFRFMFKSQDLDFNRKTSLKVRKKTISEVLEVLFKGQHLQFNTSDRQILLMKQNKKAEIPIKISTKKKIVACTTRDYRKCNGFR